MTASAHPDLAFAKGRPKALRKKDRAKVKQAIEDVENAKVRERSKGQCEVRVVYQSMGNDELVASRCGRRAFHIHHLLGGIGRRGIKESALAENKLHVCEADHDLIHAHILQVHWRDVQDRAGSSFCIRLK